MMAKAPAKPAKPKVTFLIADRHGHVRTSRPLVSRREADEAALTYIQRHNEPMAVYQLVAVIKPKPIPVDVIEISVCEADG